MIAIMKKQYWLLGYGLLAIGFSFYSEWNFGQIEDDDLAFRYSNRQSREVEKYSSPELYSEFVSGQQTKEVHSATAVTLSDGQLLLFWYGGEREGSADVSIYSRRLESSNRTWGNINKVVERLAVTHDLSRNIRKLGNPIAFEYQKNEVWLFFVSVSVGGWAGSSINVQKSFDNGKTWNKPQRLISSPFFNISTLVKERPIRYQDGTIGLPVYHEFIGKFGELLKKKRLIIVLITRGVKIYQEILHFQSYRTLIY